MEEATDRNDFGHRLEWGMRGTRLAGWHSPTTRCSTAWSASSASARPPAAGRAVRLSPQVVEQQAGHQDQQQDKEIDVQRILLQ